MGVVKLAKHGFYIEHLVNMSNNMCASYNHEFTENFLKQCSMLEMQVIVLK